MGDKVALHQFLRRIHRTGVVEAVMWTVGLAAMACMNPEGTHLISLCPLDALGASFCPGCGLGHAVAYLARGAIIESIRAHPLGIPAVVVLLVHVARLLQPGRRGDGRRRF
jgi:hypothetical protein